MELGVSLSRQKELEQGFEFSESPKENTDYLKASEDAFYLGLCFLVLVLPKTLVEAEHSSLGRTVGLARYVW